MTPDNPNSKLFFNARTNTLLRLTVDNNGLCELEIDSQTVHLPEEALKLLHYHPVSIEPVGEANIDFPKAG